MGNKIFVDTGWLKGLVDDKDQYHDVAGEILSKMRKGKEKFLTTNFVVDETFTLVRDKCGVHRAKQLKEMLRDFGAGMEIERVASDDERRVWKWFWYDWRELSYTDCTSFAVMERMGIKRVATFDEHFEMAGFERIRP